MSQPKVVIVKEFEWKGAIEEWSNSYSLKGGTPNDNAGWLELCDAIAASERRCYINRHAVTTYYGYADGDNPSTFQYDFKALGRPTDAGTLQEIQNNHRMAGDQAGWVRALVGQSSSGKNVYIRKYLHGGLVQDSGDLLAVPYVTALGAHANTMLDGSLPGGAKWVSPSGRAGISPVAARYVTTRTLKRRGKRP